MILVFIGVSNTFTAPTHDNTGCSDCGSIICSEFSSTPNTSVESTPGPSPKREKVVESSTSKGHVKPKGKDLSLLLASKPKGSKLPKESLYFREMVKQKTTARKRTGKPLVSSWSPRIQSRS